MPAATLINVNCPAGEPTGIEVTRLGKRIYNDELKLVEEDERGSAAATRSTAGNPATRTKRAPTSRPSPEGRISVTPIHFDLTDHGGLERLRGWGFEEMLAASAPNGVSASEAERRVAELRGELEAPQPPLLRPRRPRDRRRRLRRAARRAAGDRGRAPGAAHARLARPSGSGRRRWSASSRSSTSSRCSRLANARNEEELRAWETRHRQPPETTRHQRLGVQLHDRAEDRRAGDHAHLRGRGAGPRRHPRRRPGRRGRDPEPAHDRLDPAEDRRGAGADRSARRDLPADRRLQSAERTPRRGGRADLRQPAQLGRRLDPPARSRAGRRTAALDLVYGIGADSRPRPRHPHARRSSGSREHGFKVNPDTDHHARRRVSGRALPLVGGAPRARSTTRSTASWSRSTSGRCGGSWASSGREPRWAIAWKFPPTTATTRCSRSSGTSGAPGTWSRSRCWSRSTSAASPSRTATLHNEEDLARKDVRVGDEVVVMRAGDVIPQVVSPLFTAQEQERPQAEATEEMPRLRHADGQARGTRSSRSARTAPAARDSPSSTSSTSSARGRWTSTGLGRSRRCASSRRA